MKVVKRSLAVVNLIVALSSVQTLDKSEVYIGSLQVRRATKLVKLINN